MLKITGMREIGRSPIIEIRVGGMTMRAMIDTTTTACAITAALRDALGDTIDIRLTGDDGETLDLLNIATEYGELEDGLARLGWSALEHLNINMADDHSFEITGHSIA